MESTTKKNLALVGYGKMGRLLDQLSPEFGFNVVLRLDIKDNEDGRGIAEAAFREVDVAIEFSTPETAPANLARLAELSIPTVTGTSGLCQCRLRSKPHGLRLEP
jgi:4-hydroxy-tetrahydrodipicolinate reductase